MQKPADKSQKEGFEIPSEFVQPAKELVNSRKLVTLPEVIVEQSNDKPYNSSVKLQLCIDAHATYDGPVTGKHYDWARAGSIVPVDSLDAPKLLEKRIKAQSCCNGSDNPVFQIVD